MPALIFVANGSQWVHVARRNANRGISMARGTVKFFNAEKGFGFITPDSGGADIFLHISALQSSGIQALRDGQKVSFDLEPDKRGKGPKAVNIEIQSA
jgi:CspA family cold shock protein